ncbi:MAG: gliding motility-associated C-terminal domain-containing protein [Bacteroidetes bacterium]|nr:gliding motility-associated C-terminal domain-containing protein [Bacteroidota bacterium]
MKKQVLIFTLCLLEVILYSQQRFKSFNIPQKKVFSLDSLIGFNEDSVKQICREENFLGEEFVNYMQQSKRRFLDNKYNLIKPVASSQWSYRPVGSNTLLTMACNNEDFELGNISGWSLSAGSNTNSTTMGGCCPVNSLGNYSLFTAAQSDPATGISLASPLGGNYVCKINDWCNNQEVTRLSKTFAVTSANALFQIAYFAVLEQASHSCKTQPYVNVSVLNCSGTKLSCPYVQFNVPSSACTNTASSGWTSGTALNYSSPTTYTFAQGPHYTSLYLSVTTGTAILSGAACSGGFSAYWSGWKTMALDLTPYIGSCITIQLTVADCAGGSHRGWAYFDCLCSPMNITVNGTSFPAGTSASTVSSCGTTATITAPPGMGPYTWNGPAGSGVSNNHNQTFTTTTSGNYTLVMTPLGSCSSITKTVTLLPSSSPTAGFSLINACSNYTITNTGSSAPAVQSYSFQGSGAPAGYTTTAASSSVVFPSSGSYTITQVITNTNNCTASSTSVINVSSTLNPAYTVPTATQCLVGNSFNFNAVVVTGTHSYSFNPSAGAPAVGSSANYSGSFSAAGTYTVTHTISNGGCTSTATSVVLVNPTPSITASFTNATCGSSNGCIIINNVSSGGQTITGYTSNGSSIPSQTITGLSAGTYILGISNNFGCTYTISTTITNTPPITALSTTPTNPTCGNSNGSISLGATTGGTAPYTYNVNGGVYSSSPPLSGLSAGTYTVGVKDANGCTYTKTVSLTSSPGPSAISYTTLPATCSLNNGVIGITGVTGGSPAYTYSVNGSSSTGTTSGLAQGTQTILVADANGCTYSTTTNISNVSGPSSATVQTSNATCGSANGSATVTNITGGTPVYMYSFNGGAYSATSSTLGLLAGPMSVTIKDANSCTLTVNFTISNTGSPTLSVVSTTNVSCNGGNNGSVSTSASGGTLPYSYTLNPLGATNTTGNFTSLTAQGYTIILKDAAGCTSSVTFSITEPPLLTMTSPSKTNPTCGNSNGSISLGATTGGTTPYTYNVNGGVYSSSPPLSGLSAGTYTVGVKDANGCTYTKTVSLTSSPGPSAISYTTLPATCSLNNGVIGITGVTGGSPAYTYSVNGSSSTGTTSGLAQGTQTILVADANGCTYSTTANISNVPGPSSATVQTSNATCGSANGSATVTNITGGTPAYMYSFNGGAYSATSSTLGLLAGPMSVTVKDANSCTLTVNFTISNTGSPTLSVVSISNVSCNGGSDGIINASASGGIAPFNYSLNPTSASNSTGNFSSLSAQIYTIVVGDAAGCISTVTANVNQPAALNMAATSQTNTTCSNANGSLTLGTTTGGTAPYVYNLNGGAYSSATLVTGLNAGSYTIGVKDANACTLLKLVVITDSPAPTGITYTVSPTACSPNTGIIGITGITGGTPVYSYSLNGVASSSIMNSLGLGTYTLTVSDVNACTYSTTASVAMVSGITSASVITQNATCGGANGSATVTNVLGGSPAFMYSFNGGSFTSLTSVLGLSSGIKNVVIKDINNCTLTANFTINNTGSPILSIASTTNVSCNGGNNGGITANAVGGNLPYSYTISPVGTINSTGIFSSLSAQAYTITLTDAAGCLSSTLATISQPLALSITAPSVAACFGQNVTIFAQAIGGTSPYNYSLTNVSTSAVTTSLNVNQGVSINNSFTIATNYTVEASDANGCTSTASIPVIITPSLQAFGTSYTLCEGSSISLSPTLSPVYIGNGGPYNYLWQGGNASSSISVSASTLTNPATYSVVVNDKQNCTAPAAIAIFTVITQNSPIITYTSTPKQGCAPLTVNYGAAAMTGATFQYSFTPSSALNYNPSSNPITITFPQPGTYSMSISAINQWGCKSFLNNIMAAQVWPKPVAEFVANPQSADLLNSTINFTNQSTGANAYSWDFGDYTNPSGNTSSLTNPSYQYNNIGTYNVYLVAVNSNGCKDTVLHFVEITTDMAIYIPNAFTPNGDDLNDLFFPKGYGLDINRYSMEIYDRWGELIFASNSFEKGWDGTIKGNSAKEDVYTYKISAYDLQSKKREYVGHVTLLR